MKLEEGLGRKQILWVVKKVEFDTQVSILIPISCVRKVSSVNYSHYFEEAVIESHCQILSVQRPIVF